MCLKVFILTTSFPRFKGDPSGVFIYHLCRWLVIKGAEIEVLTPHDPGCLFFEKWDGIAINRFPYFYPLKNQRLCYGSGILKNIKSSFLAAIQLPFLCAAEFFYSLWRIAKFKPDVIHAHWSLPQGLVGVIAKGISGIPCVTTIHGSDVFGLRSAFFKKLNAIVFRNSDACTVNSRATARIARDVSDNVKIRVLPMGVDTTWPKKSHNVATLREKLKINGPVILFVGRLIDWKGATYLIKAMPEILQHIQEAKAILVGSGPQKDDLVHLAGTLAVEGQVVFIDEVPQQELLDFYAVADIFVLPSIINEKGENEGLGVVLLEAMASGLPVIGSNVGGIPDIVKDKFNGLLVEQKKPKDLAEKIIKLAGSEKLRVQMGENGRRFVRENFDWDIIAKRFIHVYDSLLDQSDLLKN